MRATSGLTGASDADILVSLNEQHHPTANYARELRRKVPEQFPGVTFYFLPADIVTQILNFGLPAPIDIQIDGADIEGNRAVAEHVLTELRHVPGSPTSAYSKLSTIRHFTSRWTAPKPPREASRHATSPVACLSLSVEAFK